MGNSKVWMLITGIVVMLSGLLLYSTMKSKEAERSSFMTKMQALQVKVEELSRLQTDLDEVRRQKAELEAKSQADVAALEARLSESKRNEASLKVKIDTLTKEKDALNKYMENNNTIVAKLQKKIEALERDKKELQADIRRAEQTLTAAPRFTDPMSQPSEDDANGESLAEPPSPRLADSMGKSLEGGSKLAADDAIDLGRIILRKSTSQPAAVEYVNSLYGFVVLSAGTNDGLKKDSVVIITRSNRLIAKAVVKKIRQETASAVTLPEWTREEIKVGDLVSVTGLMP